jgi:predicted homoserine dehydrogenase-like protein
MKSISRSTFLKMTALAGSAFTVLPSKVVFGSPNSKIRIGMIGVGLRGQDHLGLCLQRVDTEVFAICDIQQVMIDDALKQFNTAGKPVPTIYQDGKYAYRELLARKDIDAVIISTPWEWHYQMAMDAMDAGKHVGCEVVVGTLLMNTGTLSVNQNQRV